MVTGGVLKNPKCPDCLTQGLIVQTYHLTGKGMFRCHDKGTLFNKVYFEPIDFEWDVKPYEWRKKHKLDVNNKPIKDGKIKKPKKVKDVT